MLTIEQALGQGMQEALDRDPHHRRYKCALGVSSRESRRFQAMEFQGPTNYVVYDVTPSGGGGCRPVKELPDDICWG
jgi:hypothetical protein